jgi:hypothetical protein
MTSMLEDGIHPVIAPRPLRPRSSGRISRLLKFMAKSPAHCHEVARHAGRGYRPEEDRPRGAPGIVRAGAVPQPPSRCGTAAPGAARTGTAFCSRNQGLELLTVNEHEKCLAIQNAVRNDPAAKRYLSDGRGEVTLTWSTKINGGSVRCKGRIDFDAESALVDLKTTKCAAPGDFGRQAYALHYRRAVRLVLRRLRRGRRNAEAPYVIVAVESTAPYVVQVYRVPEHVIQVGREKYRAWLDVFTYCRERNKWPGYTDHEELELMLPPWAMPLGTNDPTGLGLDFEEG